MIKTLLSAGESERVDQFVIGCTGKLAASDGPIEETKLLARIPEHLKPAVVQKMLDELNVIRYFSGPRLRIRSYFVCGYELPKNVEFWAVEASGETIKEFGTVPSLIDRQARYQDQAEATRRHREAEVEANQQRLQVYHEQRRAVRRAAIHRIDKLWISQRQAAHRVASDRAGKMQDPDDQQQVYNRAMSKFDNGKNNFYRQRLQDDSDIRPDEVEKALSEAFDQDPTNAPTSGIRVS